MVLTKASSDLQPKESVPDVKLQVQLVVHLLVFLLYEFLESLDCGFLKTFPLSFHQQCPEND